MSLFAPRMRAERDELIDSEDPSDADFAASFGDIARVNRFLGGTQAILSALTPLVRGLPEGSNIRILDIATGSADIPRALAAAARRGQFGPGRTLKIVATDNHSKVLALAERSTPRLSYPEIRVEQADAFALPYPNSSFDIALCSMAFHHFPLDRCVFLLQEMERVSRIGFIVNDLLRDRVAMALIWALTRIVGANRLTRHDAPLSVLRAYTLAEYREMARLAGIPECQVRLVPIYRAVMIRDKRDR